MALLKKISRWCIYVFIGVFALMNIISMFHAYKFTHFKPNESNEQKKHIASSSDKIKAILMGVDNPRPFTKKTPPEKFETILLEGDKKIECWSIKTDSVARGTIVLFHGYCDEKSSLIDRSSELLKLGYNTLLVDFMGSGGSEGNQTTIGYKECEQVKLCFDYLTAKGEKNIYLYGVSMGAAAVLKSIDEYSINPKAILLECPFSTFYEAVCVRFRLMKVPTFPMANILMFWGSVENGFWGFSHNPIEYAKSVKCPTLLMHGDKDPKVTSAETQGIFSNLQGKKQLKTYPLSVHESYLIKHKQEWLNDVNSFLKN